MRLPFLLAALAALPFAAADPLGHPSCGASSVVAFAQGQGVVENLLFDGAGSLFVTTGGNLVRFAPDGSSQPFVSGIGGGLALGTDGMLYAGVLNNLAQSVLQTQASSVARIDRATGTSETFASGFDMANGLAFDGAGNLYVSNDVGDHIVRVASDGTWSAWAEVYGANGMVVVDDVLFAALTFDQRSPIVAVDLDDAEVREIAALSFGAVTLQPGIVGPSSPTAPLVPQGLDDMTLGEDGALYVAAQVPGALLRVDPATGAACVVASGMPNASSVRFARGFGSWDGAAFVTAFDGHIWALR